MTITRFGDNEAAAWRTVLENLVPDSRPPAPGSPEETCLRAMSAVLSQKRIIDPIFLRPKWLREDLLTLLINEAQEQKQEGTDRASWYNSQAGRVGKRLAASPTVIQWTAAQLGTDLKNKVGASHTWYDTGGHFQPMHLDYPDRFGEFTLLICLERVRVSERGGTRTHFALENGITSVDLSVGEAVLFHGAYTPHSRSALLDGEKVTVLTLGYTSAHHDGEH